MGLFNSIVGSVLSGGNSQQGQVMQLVSMLMQENGGASGLLGKLQQGGLGDAVSSWIGQGENQTVDSGSLENALGSGTIASLAQKSGLDNSAVSGLLAQFLPSIIDKITPNGQAEEADGFDLSDGLDLGDISALASKFLK